MRLSTTLLAAGFTSSVFAAPIAESVNFDQCEWNEPESRIPSPSSSPTGVALYSLVPTASASVVASASPVTADVSSSPVVASAGAVTADVSSSSAVASASPVTADVSSSPVVASASAATTQKSSSAVASASPVTTQKSSSAVASASPVTAQKSSSSSNGKFQFFGVNESGAEFGTAIPGVLGTDYAWPSTDAIGVLMDEGRNTFRIPFKLERLAPSVMTATLDPTYLANLKKVVSFITGRNGYAAIEPHNFGRYDGTIFTSTSDFKTFWYNVATEFKSDANVIFDCNNEFHDMPSNELVANLNQACIDGVRAAGATSQYIFVEGTAYTGAWTWVSSGNGDAMAGLTDPSDKIIYEMHQYLDADGSGTSDICVSTTIGAERVAAATAWLRANNKKGVIGEFAGGANAVCETAVTGLLNALSAATDVWTGALWWGGGPMWGNYIFSMEPPSGTAYSPYVNALSKFT